MRETAASAISAGSSTRPSGTPSRTLDSARTGSSSSSDQSGMDLRSERQWMPRQGERGGQKGMNGKRKRSSTRSSDSSSGLIMRTAGGGTDLVDGKKEGPNTAKERIGDLAIRAGRRSACSRLSSMASLLATHKDDSSSLVHRNKRRGVALSCAECRRYVPPMQPLQALTPSPGSNSSIAPFRPPRLSHSPVPARCSRVFPCRFAPPRSALRLISSPPATASRKAAPPSVQKVFWPLSLCRCPLC